MEIPEILEKTGLNQKEALVYMALLELGTSSVEGIAKKAGTKRPTTYLILDELQRKGLASLVPRAKKTLYTAESPEQIISHLNRQQELVKRFLPNMLAIYNSKKEKPQILLFEGKHAVREVYEKMLRAKEVNIFCTIQDVMNIYPDLPQRLMQQTVEKKTKLRELLARTPRNVEFAKSMTHSEYYEHRFAKPGQDFLTDNILFDNNIAFFSYEPHIFAVLIQSKTIYQSLRTLFELAWTQAEPYEKVVKEGI
jgi:HTH-type transcriptional regulator, sugar sensing transcriptional regulator